MSMQERKKIIQILVAQECWTLVDYASPIIEYKLYIKGGQLAFRNMNTGVMNPVSLKV